MPINKNHEFEELDGVKCGIVEKNVPASRCEFLKQLLTDNGFTVVVVPSPAPKTAPAKPTTEGETVVATAEAAPPQTFTVGVTDYTFNAINAIFGRLLKTTAGTVVTQAYWLQQEDSPADEVPYYERKVL
jgi:hypothetical protein